MEPCGLEWLVCWYNEVVNKIWGLRALWVVMLLCAAGLGVYAYFASSKAVVLVEWSTASELDTAGYNIFRSESPESGFVKLNQQIIPGSADPWVGSDYSFSDKNTVPGVTYYYLLEDVGLDGATNRHGPVEITATAGGRLETVLAIALFVVACGGLWVSARRGREPEAEHDQPPATDPGE